MPMTRRPFAFAASAMSIVTALRPEVEAIILTGYPSVEGALEGMRLGAYEFLSKPCSTETLYERVMEALSHQAGGQEAS